MDPEILRAVNELALTIGGVAAGKPLVEKTLSPAAEYVGDSLRGLLERAGNVNVLDVLRRAHRRLGTFADEPGHVNPRVLKSVIEDAAVCDDVLTREYYAALLAAARTPDGEDDAVLQLVRLLRDLPVRQVKVHYIMYRLHRKHYGGTQLTTADERQKAELWIPEKELRETAGVQGERALDVMLVSLGKEELLDSRTERVTARYREPELRFIPSLLGAELYDCVATGVRGEQDGPELRLLNESIRKAYKAVRRLQREHQRSQKRAETELRSGALAKLVTRIDDALSLFDSAGISLPADLGKEIESEVGERFWWHRRDGRPENERERLAILREELERERERLSDWWDDDYDYWHDEEDDAGA